MNTHQTDDVIAGYRKATDAQQQVIADLRHEISILRNKIGALDRHMNACRKISKCPDDDTLAVWLKGCVRLDDPVVTGLVDTLEKIDASGRNHGSDPLTGEACGCESCENYFAIEKALSAYDARVKSVESEWQNHGHLAIDHKYNNETTTMSYERVKEVEK